MFEWDPELEAEPDSEPEPSLNLRIDLLHRQLASESIVHAVAARWLSQTNSSQRRLTLHEFKRELTRALQLRELPRPLASVCDPGCQADTDRHPLAVS